MENQPHEGLDQPGHPEDLEALDDLPVEVDYPRSAWDVDDEEDA